MTGDESERTSLIFLWQRRKLVRGNVRTKCKKKKVVQEQGPMMLTSFKDAGQRGLLLIYLQVLIIVIVIYTLICDRWAIVPPCAIFPPNWFQCWFQANQLTNWFQANKASLFNKQPKLRIICISSVQDPHYEPQNCILYV